MKKIIFFLLLFLSFESLSQVDTLRLKLNLTLGGSYTGGNFSLYRITTTSSLTLENKKNEITFLPSFQFSKTSNNGVSFILREREFLYSIFYTRRQNQVRFIFYNESESSFLRKINFRSSAGFGLGIKIIKNKSLELDFSELILPELLFSDFGNSFDNFATRLSSRLKFIFKIKSLTISSITLFQPSLLTLKSGNTLVKPKDNIILRSQNIIEFTPINWFSIGVGNDFIYQTYSVSINPNLKAFDYNLSIFLKFKK